MECGDEGWFSVWAMPPSNQPGMLQSMAMLRKEFEGPEFDPHITIVGAQKLPLVKAIDRLQAVCRSLPPFNVRLTVVAYGGSYYECVYMLVEPSSEVMQTNLHVRHFFGLVTEEEASDSKESSYMPHLSLLYRDLSDEEKLKAKEMVEEKYGKLLSDSQFQVSSLCLYSTDTNDKLLKSWKKVVECPLEGNRSQ